MYGLTYVGVDVDTSADGRRGRGLQRRLGVPAILQLAQLVLVERPVTVDFPREVLRADRHGAERNLDTLVLDAAGVNLHCRGTDFGTLRGADNLVGGRGLVEGQVDVESALEELRVKTDFPAVGLLGTNQGVGQRGGQRESAGVVRGRVVGVEREDARVVTDACPRCAQLDHVDPARVELQRLVEQDAGAHRRIEVGPLRGVERRRPVVAGRHVEEVGIVPREVQEAVEAVDGLVAAVGRDVKRHGRVGERVHARALDQQLRSLRRNRVVLVAQRAAAEGCRQVEAVPEALVVLEQEVR